MTSYYLNSDVAAVCVVGLSPASIAENVLVSVTEEVTYAGHEGFDSLHCRRGILGYLFTLIFTARIFIIIFTGIFVY